MCLRFFRTELLLCAFLIVLGGSNVLAQLPQDAAHDACPTPQVDIFDLAVPPAPGKAGAPVTRADANWATLTTATGGVNGALMNSDPTHSLIEYLDSTVGNANGQAVPKYIPGLDTAPSGSVDGVDYVVEGQISGHEGAYTVTVSLEDAKTRAHIADGSASFTKSSQAMEAAQKAASQLTPVYTKIRAYQEKLKEQNPDMAISPTMEEPKIVPARTSLKVGSSTPVSLELMDCDGQPLKNRTLKLQATLGQIAAASVQTDSSGHASATFTGRQSGLAHLRADFPFQTVMHQPNFRRGYATVAIESSGFWVFDIDANWQEVDSAVGGRNGSSETKRILWRSALHATEWVKTRDPLAFDGGEEPDWEDVSGQVQGSWSLTGTDRWKNINTMQSCIVSLSGEGSTPEEGEGPPDFEIDSLKPMKVVFEGGFNGTQYIRTYCAVAYANKHLTIQGPIDISSGVRVQNFGDWTGTCTPNGDVKHGYTVVCDTSYRDECDGRGGDFPPCTQTQTGHLRVTMTPLTRQ
jgi:hypothetical protein